MTRPPEERAPRLGDQVALRLAPATGQTATERSPVTTYLRPDEIERLRAAYGSDFYVRLLQAQAELRDAIAAVDAVIADYEAIPKRGIAAAGIGNSE